MSSCPSRFELALLEVGDLSDAEATRIIAHMETCEGCRQSMADLKFNTEQYLTEENSHLSRLRARIDEDGTTSIEGRRRQSLTFSLTIAGGLAAAAALLLGLYVVLGAGPPKPADDSIQFKGAVSVEVVAKRGDRQFKVEHGSALIENDALRFIVTTGSSGYLDLFSVDSTGQLSPFYPESDPTADPSPLSLEDPGRHVLPGSVILDDAVGEEHLVMVFSKTLFDRNVVQKEIRSKGAIEPHAIIERPGGDGKIIVERLTIRKESNLMR